MTALAQYIGKMKNFAMRRPWLTTLIVAVVVLGGLWMRSSGNNQPVAATAEVTRGDISQTVSVTGRVKPASDVELSFEKGGRVARVYHKVGDRVGAGALLVALENGDISAQLAQARATVKGEEAQLAELKQGTRVEDLNVSRVAVSNAFNNVVNDIRGAYVDADDAIHNKVDQLFSNPRSASPQFTFTISNSQLKNDIETQRPSFELMLISWNTSITGIANVDSIDSHATQARENLRSIQTYLDKVASAVNSLIPSSTLSQTTIDSYKSAVLSARTNVTTALDTLATSEQALRTAESQLALKEAGSTKEQIDAQEAQLEAAQANVMNLEAQLGKTVIRSPIAGVVTRQDAKAGQIASVGTSLVSVISDGRYEIEADVPEADIAKIKIGNEADVTLDAYGNDVVFKAVISQIDPAETIIEDVATYRTTLQFTKSDSRIKSGMTANTDIFGERREDVLSIPSRAVFTKTGKRMVTLIEGNQTREVEVETGLRGSNGEIEILSGLSEGQKVKVN